MLPHFFVVRVAAFSLILAPGSLLAQPVGTTTAVVPDAFALGPAAAPQVIEIGDQIISNQRVETNDNGLVQILLADGSSFTIGPNSSMVIDTFVYDPQTDTASLAASASRGFLRFIGGTASKSDSGVTITTPVATAGIRGAIVDIAASEQNGLPPGFSLVFGSALSVTTPEGEQQRTTQSGQTIFVSDGATSLVPTPPQLSTQFTNIISNSAPPGQSVVNGVQIEQLIQSLPPAQMGSTGQSEAPASGGFVVLNQAISALIEQAQVNGNVQAGTIDRIVIEAPIGDREPEPAPVPEPEPTNPNGQYHGLGFGVGSGAISPALGPVAITLDLDDMALEGSFETGYFPQQEVFVFAPEDSTIVPDGTFAANNDQGNLQSSAQPLCAQCDFMEWGTWSTTPSAPETIENGHWVLGDQTTAQQIEGLTGTARYSGNAVGYATGSSGSGMADGTFDAGMNFGSGTGWIEFDSFGNDLAGRRDFGIQTELDETGRTFVSTNFIDPTESSPVFGDMQGGFANDGADVAKGIMGGFTVNAPSDNWSATGVFAGTRQN